MSNQTLKILNNSQLKINKIIKTIEEDLLNIDDFTIEEIEELHSDLDNAKKIMHSIKISCKTISSKVQTKIAMKTPEIKTKLKDKKSFEFNEVLLYQGKPAKALNNLEEKAKKGDLDSQFLTGKTYLNGVIGFYDDVKMRDVGLGLKWLTVAYKNGHQEAGFLIANYEKSVLNTSGAIKIFEKLGKEGHINSLKELVHIYKTDPRHENLERVLEIKNKLSRT